MIEKEITMTEDKETVWNKSLYHLGNVYEMYTTDKLDMQKALKLAKKYPDDVKVVHDDKYGMTFQFSMTGGSLFWRPKVKRQLSEEQRLAAVERLRASKNKETT